MHRDVTSLHPHKFVTSPCPVNKQIFVKSVIFYTNKILDFNITNIDGKTNEK